MTKKNVILVGGSRGIGKSLAKILSQEHNVLLISRNEERLKALAAECGESLSTLALDICADNFKALLSDKISAHFDRVDVLINNAGYLVNKPLLDTSLEDIDKVYRTNVFGLIAACQAVVPFMQKDAHIVNIGSIGGIQGSVKFPGIGVYSSSKAAVAGFTECLAVELEEKGIQVNCLALGAVQTEMLAEAFPAYTASMGPDKMAAYIAEFALTANSWMNGKIVPISNSTP